MNFFNRLGVSLIQHFKGNNVFIFNTAVLEMRSSGLYDFFNRLGVSLIQHSQEILFIFYTVITPVSNSS